MCSLSTFNNNNNNFLFFYQNDFCLLIFYLHLQENFCSFQRISTHWSGIENSNDHFSPSVDRFQSSRRCRIVIIFNLFYLSKYFRRNTTHLFKGQSVSHFTHAHAHTYITKGIKFSFLTFLKSLWITIGGGFLTLFGWFAGCCLLGLAAISTASLPSCIKIYI